MATAAGIGAAGAGVGAVCSTGVGYIFVGTDAGWATGGVVVSCGATGLVDAAGSEGVVGEGTADSVDGAASFSGCIPVVSSAMVPHLCLCINNSTKYLRHGSLIYDAFNALG